MSSYAMIFSIIFTWIVILIPPAIIRFILVRKPINSKVISGVISGGLYFANLMFFIALGSQSKSHAVLFLGMLACYGILKYETKEQAKNRVLEEKKKLGYD